MSIKMPAYEKTVTLDNMNPHILSMKFAIRGPILDRAMEIEKELQKGVEKPFKEVIKANGGDCQAMGQKPLTYVRQTLTLAALPELLEDPSFPDDVKLRAKQILDSCMGGSIGSYTDAHGIWLIRQQIAEYITERDGVPSRAEDIFVSPGTTLAIKFVMSLLKARINGKRAGIMIPVPRYPLYSAVLMESNIQSVGYYLNEEKNWSLEVEELERSYQEGLQSCKLRGIIVTNPGNPTSSVLTKEDIRNIIKFAYSKKLFIFADEVYQHNIYEPTRKFHSIKKIMREMGHPYCQMELASFMSFSKGYLAESGLRAGYAELINIDPAVKELFDHSMTGVFCTNTLAQTVISCAVTPPKVGEPSYDLFIKEREAILDSLKKRARTVVERLNSIPGIVCQTVQGGLHAFPKIDLPPKAIAKAKTNNQDPSEFYAFELLENTGICFVPGSGFGQKPGTYHLRVPIAAQPEKLSLILDKLEQFHLKFIERYS